MNESISLTVPPSMENDTISLKENFGWTLKSSQEINTISTHQEDRDDGVYRVTSGQNYVKLVFTRDTNIPNYTRIKELEIEYDKILNAEPTEPISLFPLKVHLIIGGILLLLYVIPGVIYFIIYFKKKKKNEQEYLLRYKNWKDKMNTEGKKYLDEATSLLA